MGQAEGANCLSQPDHNWQSSTNSVRERNAMMLQKALLADVCFLVGSGSTQRRIAAHKCMLAAGSSVFHAMFVGGLAEGNEVSIPDVEPEVFLNLLKWVLGRFIWFEPYSEIFMKTIRPKTYIFFFTLLKIQIRQCALL